MEIPRPGVGRLVKHLVRHDTLAILETRNAAILKRGDSETRRFESETRRFKVRLGEGRGSRAPRAAIPALRLRFKPRFSGDSSIGVGDSGPTKAAIQHSIVRTVRVTGRNPEPGDSETRRF